MTLLQFLRYEATRGAPWHLAENLRQRRALVEIVRMAKYGKPEYLAETARAALHNRKPNPKRWEK